MDQKTVNLHIGRYTSKVLKYKYQQWPNITMLTMRHGFGCVGRASGRFDMLNLNRSSLHQVIPVKDRRVVSSQVGQDWPYCALVKNQILGDNAASTFVSTVVRPVHRELFFPKAGMASSRAWLGSF